MFDSWFGKSSETDLPLSGSGGNGNGDYRSTASNERYKKGAEPPRSGAKPADRKPSAFASPPPFEQIYENAAVKPPKLVYGIQKVVEMSASAHLAGISAEMKRRALLMALEAAGTDVGEVLNDVVTRQRALMEYEESYLEKVEQFEFAQAEQNRLQQLELEKITSQFNARIEAALDEVARRREELRAWQKSKQQEVQRFTEVVALCVPQQMVERDGEDSDGKVTAIHQRAAGAYR
ncbi:MAG: hypothetical protein ABSB15_14605 [Bryobacteraceae bacterium]|jgi:hypothetical protein